MQCALFAEPLLRLIPRLAPPLLCTPTLIPQVAIARDELDTYFCEPCTADAASLWWLLPAPAACLAAAVGGVVLASWQMSCAHPALQVIHPTPEGLNLLLTLLAWLPVSPVSLLLRPSR